MHKIIASILFILVLNIPIHSQILDKNKTQFGITMGMILSNHQLQLSPEKAQVNGIESTTISGPLGLIMSSNFIPVINENLKLNIGVGLSFQGDSIQFNKVDKSIVKKRLPLNGITFPVNAIYRFNPDHKFGPVATLGFNYLINIFSYEEEDKVDLIKHDLYLEFGTGVEVTTKKAFLRFDLTYNYGILNLAKNSLDDFPNIFNSISRQYFTFKVSLYGNDKLLDNK